MNDFSQAARITVSKDQIVEISGLTHHFLLEDILELGKRVRAIQDIAGQDIEIGRITVPAFSNENCERVLVEMDIDEFAYIHNKAIELQYPEGRFIPAESELVLGGLE